MKKVARIVVVLALVGGASAIWWYDPLEMFGRRAETSGALMLFGNVDIRQVDLGFRVPGRLLAMTVEEGDMVAADQELARLDPRPYEDALRSAQAEVARQAALLEKVMAGPRPAEIAQARAVVAERKATQVNARRQYDRRAKLVRSGAVTRASLDDALAAKTEAAARLNSAQKALDLLVEGSRQEDIAAAKASREAAAAALKAAETSLADTHLYAPADGVVLSRVREPGAVVSAGNVVYTLSLKRPVWVRSYVDEPALGCIHPGLAVQVVTDTRPDAPYVGKVGFVSPVAEFTPKSVETREVRTDLVYRFRVIVDAPDEHLRQGMPVTVRLPAGACGR